MIRDLHFPTPIYIFDHNDPSLNIQLEKDILNWMNEDKGLSKTNIKGWHSPTNMDKKPEYERLVQGLFEAPPPPKTKKGEDEKKPLDALQPILFCLAKFIEEEKPRYEYMKRMEEEEEEYYTEPTEDNSTALGEVPHAREKGSIRPGIFYQSYMHNRYYRR